ncbi:DNA gyrase inhibitor YacG [Roseobacter sp. HKCCA0434]|uniref:DNA gyrase inhibitor YacG n=1 Tax=Roseobacter sp. HKCCA0434 TaxID=3079297 RepID=UPI002905F687|nr:DNA gyrase inhibitor YacG [Roseobacter sp. HKCCA0434]
MSCPICGRPKQPDYRPFCSKHCADVDLSRWFDGSYAIPDESAEEAEQTPPQPVFRGDDV